MYWCSYQCCSGGQSRGEYSSLCDTSHTPARGVMRIVPDRSAATLLPIIQQHVRSGTIVHSDEWAAYNHVQHLPSVGQHGVGNHSLHFVDPATSVQTQHAESYWNRVKMKFKRMKGVHETRLPSYLVPGRAYDVMEVPLPQLWQVCVRTLLSGTPFRIPRCTICWSTSLTVFVFVFSTGFF